jgi:hypothetical protein
VPAGSAAPRAPGRLEIVRAIPGGSRRARDQRAWLRAVAAAIEPQGWYACRAHHTAEVARLLARSMDWREKTSRPGHEHIAAAACISLRTVRRVMRWLESEQLLGLVSPGTTPEFRPGVLHGLSGQGEGNLAAVYVLCVPRKRPCTAGSSADFGRPSCSRRELGVSPRPREARAGNPEARSARAPRAQPRVPHPAEPFPQWQTPKTRSESLAAASVVRNRARQLRQLSPEHWRYLARGFTGAGWCAGDVLYALDHGPGGRQHFHTADVRNVAGWARHRLGLWLDDLGTPLPSPSQIRAAGHESVLAEQRGRRQARQEAAERAATVDVAAHAARARAMLAARR